MNETGARQRLEAARVARLATVDSAGRPHIVPMVFVMSGDTIVSAVDAKPKRSRALRRLANIAQNPNVTVLADEYHDDWSQLWWVRADGSAQVLSATDAADWLAILIDKYDQYQVTPPNGPVIVITVSNIVGWSASG